MVYDDVAKTLQLNVSFSGLTGLTTASHIHAATATAFLRDGGSSHHHADVRWLSARRHQWHVCQHLGSDFGIELQSGLRHCEWGNAGLCRTRAGGGHGERQGVLEYSLLHLRRRRFADS